MSKIKIDNNWHKISTDFSLINTLQIEIIFSYSVNKKDRAKLSKTINELLRDYLNSIESGYGPGDK